LPSNRFPQFLIFFEPPIISEYLYSLLRRIQKGFHLRIFLFKLEDPLFQVENFILVGRIENQLLDQLCSLFKLLKDLLNAQKYFTFTDISEISGKKPSTGLTERTGNPLFLRRVLV
jgi:hypothetical protein